MPSKGKGKGKARETDPPEPDNSIAELISDIAGRLNAAIISRMPSIEHKWDVPADVVERWKREGQTMCEDMIREDLRGWLWQSFDRLVEPVAAGLEDAGVVEMMRQWQAYSSPPQEGGVPALWGMRYGT